MSSYIEGENCLGIIGSCEDLWWGKGKWPSDHSWSIAHRGISMDLCQTDLGMNSNLGNFRARLLTLWTSACLPITREYSFDRVVVRITWKGYIKWSTCSINTFQTCKARNMLSLVSYIRSWYCLTVTILLLDYQSPLIKPGQNFRKRRDDLILFIVTYFININVTNIHPSLPAIC